MSPSLASAPSISNDAEARANAPPSAAIGPGVEVALWTLGVALFMFPWRARAVLGDAAVYASTIASGTLFERSIHVGYFAVGRVVGMVAGRLGSGLDDALIGMDALLVGLACGLFARLLRALDEPPATRVLAVIAFAFAGVMLAQGTAAEIYALEMVCLMASAVLLAERRAVASGLLYGAALLVTPLSAFGAAFFAWEAGRRRTLRPLVVVAAIAALVWGAVVALCWRDYFFGTRGLLTVGPQRAFGWATIAYNLGALAKNLHVLLPFVAVGIAAWIARRNAKAWLVPLALAFNGLALAGMREQGVFVIAAYPFLALAAAQGVVAAAVWLPARARPASIAFVGALYVALAATIWLEVPSDDMRTELRAFFERAPAHAVVVTSWDYAMAIAFYAKQWGVAHPPLVVQEDNLTPRGLATLLWLERDVYAIEKLYPSRAVRWMLPPAALARRVEHLSLLGHLARLEPRLRATAIAVHPGGPDLYRLSLAGH